MLVVALSPQEDEWAAGIVVAGVDAYGDSCNGQTSTTPCATAQGVCDTMSMASATVAASMMANPATGSVEDMKGPSSVVTSAASWFRTCTGGPATPMSTPFWCS